MPHPYLSAIRSLISLPLQLKVQAQRLIHFAQERWRKVAEDLPKSFDGH